MDKVDLVRTNYQELDLSTLKILKMVMCSPNEVEDDRPISNLSDVMVLGTKNELKNSSDFGFRVYTNIKIPTTSILAKQEYDNNNERNLHVQEQDSLFVNILTWPVFQKVVISHLERKKILHLLMIFAKIKAFKEKMKKAAYSESKLCNQKI